VSETTEKAAASNPTGRLLAEELGDRVLEVSEMHGDLAIRIQSAALLDAARLLKEHPELDYCYLMDIAAVDHLGRDPRFEVIYNFYSLRHGHRVRIHVRVPEEAPVLDSLYPLWPAADWFEREAWDLMGVEFRGHPRLVRILTHPEFVGHALRKDYPSAERHRLSRTYDLFSEEKAGAPPAE
jgi:NADH:ubiquinone oxidoreductase subunit C